MRKRRIDMEKEQFWRAVFHRFQGTGLPFRKFCEMEGLSPHNFQSWRKKLRERDEGRGIPTTISKGDNRAPRTAEKAAYWLAMIDDANAYNGSIRSFCKERGISSGSLHHWEQRLKRSGLTAGVRKDPEQATLVPMRVVDDQIAPESVPVATPVSDEQKVEIRLHDGNRVLLPASLPAEMLIQLLNGLRGKRC